MGPTAAKPCPCCCTVAAVEARAMRAPCANAADDPQATTTIIGMIARQISRERFFDLSHLIIDPPPIAKPGRLAET
jgi:hypothetical protein